MKKFKILFAFALVAIATTVTLSSFSGKAEAKQADAKTFDPITLYYDGSTWVEEEQPGACNNNGALCQFEYDPADFAAGRPQSTIIADVNSASAGVSNRFTDGLPSHTVLVPNGSGGQVSITIFEKTAQ